MEYYKLISFTNISFSIYSTNTFHFVLSMITYAKICNSWVRFCTNVEYKHKVNGTDHRVHGNKVNAQKSAAFYMSTRIENETLNNKPLITPSEI
jgi:hypothetical protein